ncbi:MULTISPECIES: SDR family oxidoreductase [unclassified Pseudomonas]|uniref:SDR family NAD(P)-dependent oxidoreductase n=1 Tax=unclassified Pseudomonas TaxID=196821 RepID=UPI000D39C70F|nr:MULTISPECIES: SDR family oxidoreductase [unclassified Pseudomonas]RAU43864.1 SDR family NAD(P)-dependent oxidoreductase [Pseudomonas sp. RIT 409]RAU56242.1 SDR family NAD(P)-dependent oxidoreductase [Pseudomonas sp. RIT 412]
MNVIVITGGSRGIGASAAIECSRRNLGVVLTYNQNAEAAFDVVRRIVDEGGKAVALPLDVAEVSTFGSFKDALENALEATWGEVGLSGLVNNAGYGMYNPIVSTTEAEFDGLMNVHLKGPFFLTQALLPLMKEGACIVNLTSATTRVATPGVAPYATFKGGLEVLTRYMAAEFSARRIRVNSVSPGPIRTELGGGLSDEFESLLASQTALGRVGEPQEVARVIASLLTLDGGWINAQNIEVSGGYII